MNYQNHTDGILHAHLAGQRVFSAEKSAEYLHINLADSKWRATGECIKIGWCSDGDKLITGEPAFCGYQSNGMRSIHTDGVINHYLRGKTITHAMKGDGLLMLGLADINGAYSGIDMVISWVDAEGKQIMGEPAFCGQHVHIVVPMPAPIFGIAG